MRQILAETLEACNRPSFLGLSEKEYLKLSGCTPHEICMDCLKKYGPDLTVNQMLKHGVPYGHIKIASTMHDLKMAGRVMAKDVVRNGKLTTIWAVQTQSISDFQLTGDDLDY